MFAKIILWYLKRNNLDDQSKALVLNHLIRSIGGLPIKDIITHDIDGTMVIRGKKITPQQVTALQQSAEALRENPAYLLIKEQVSFEAVKYGVHSSLSFDMLLISKSAIWIQQQENRLISLLLGE